MNIFVIIPLDDLGAGNELDVLARRKVLWGQLYGTQAEAEHDLALMDEGRSYVIASVQLNSKIIAAKLEDTSFAVPVV